MEKKRITLDDRINIQAGLAKNKSLKDISRIIKKHPSTIYREIKKYSYKTDTIRKSCYYCQSVNQCRFLGVLKNEHMKFKCRMFTPIICDKLKKFPFVCNGCPYDKNCYRTKIHYDCIKAQYISIKDRKGTRCVSRISSEIITKIDAIVAPLVRKGQSLHHIYVTNPILQEYCSERTIRRLIYRRYLSVHASDLPRYLRYKRERSEYKPNRSTPIVVERMLERTYTDFLRYTKNHPDASVVQYDSVVGKKRDQKAILTITFPKERFQFGRLVRKGDAKYVMSVMDYIFSIVGNDLAKEIFAVNLSDNGCEFSLFHQLEVKNVRVYFTKPYCSIDKASCERNHEFIRYIIPKNKTMDNLTQEKVNLMFSHINSYVRESNQNKTPYDLILERFGKDFLDLIGIKKIAPQDVIMNPGLLV